MSGLSADEAGGGFARASLYQTLAGFWLHPDGAFAADLERGELAVRLTQAAMLAGRAELVPWIEAVERAVARDMTEPGAAGWAQEHGRLFAHGASVACPPYETEYRAAHVFQQTNEMADVAGFYRAFGFEAAAGLERPDHLAAELEFMCVLSAKEGLAIEAGDAEAAAICRDAQVKFLADHLGVWVGAFARRVSDAGRLRFYPAVAALLEGWIEAECARLGARPQKVGTRPFLSRDGTAELLAPVVPPVASIVPPVSNEEGMA